MEDSLFLDDDDKEDLLNGLAVASLPDDLSEDQRKALLSETVYPVVDIAYLAVYEKSQRQGIGTAILKKIFEIVKAKGSYSFITVDALYLKGEYRADTFYERMGFQRLYPPTSENTIRMYTTIF